MAIIRLYQLRSAKMIDTTELKSNVEQLAKEEGKTEIEIISSLQAACAVTKNDELLDALCELKWDYIKI
jgi:predicted negative regulator of RcsB-dependent stress response